MTVEPDAPEAGLAVSQSLPLVFNVQGQAAVRVKLPAPPVAGNEAVAGEIAKLQLDGWRMETPVELTLMDPTRSMPVVLAATE